MNVMWNTAYQSICHVISTVCNWMICLIIPYLVEGTWTLWSAWSTCDVTCDNGTQARLRMCYNPSISTEELACEGSLTDLRECQKDPCPGESLDVITHLLLFYIFVGQKK